MKKFCWRCGEKLVAGGIMYYDGSTGLPVRNSHCPVAGCKHDDNHVWKKTWSGSRCVNCGISLAAAAGM